MKYDSGVEIELGDQVILNDDEDGVVVAIIEQDKFLLPFSREAWNHVETGIIVNSSKYGVFHYPTVNDEIVFRSRIAR